VPGPRHGDADPERQAGLRREPQPDARGRGVVERGDGVGVLVRKRLRPGRQFVGPVGVQDDADLASLPTVDGLDPSSYSFDASKTRSKPPRNVYEVHERFRGRSVP